jgi:NAD(P)-dependent dehydrogenase (short-subunit alcohol dehydrogenase family)
MTPEVEDAVRQANLQARLGTPHDCARLVRFLCSQDGQWINGQLLYSNGGLAWRTHGAQPGRRNNRYMTGIGCTIRSPIVR